MRETDLILGRFADAHVGSLSEAEMVDYERLLEVRDADLLAWVTGEAAIPTEIDTPLFRRICDFQREAAGKV